MNKMNESMWISVQGRLINLSLVKFVRKDEDNNTLIISFVGEEYKNFKFETIEAMRRTYLDFELKLIL